MRHTPSALKWLADKRRRLASDLAHTTAIATDVNRRVELLKQDLEALDRTIVVFDSSIDPEELQPVRAHKRTGKRGSLRQAVLSILESHSPHWVTTENVEALACLEMSISFETTTVRKHWYETSLTRLLRLLAADGLVERHHDPTVFTSEVGRWRWKQEVRPTLANLRARTDISNTDISNVVP